jgi:aminoglycoside 3-N-acetyltransferase
LGIFDQSSDKGVLKGHFDALSKIIDFSVGTLVISTSSTNLCNTKNPFDIDKTPSERGVLSEFIRKSSKVVRSAHPFHSYAAIGKNAKLITSNVSRHAFGPETPEDRLVKMNAICVSVGLHARLTCTTVHHVEMKMGVPYRYNKEYIHPIVCNQQVEYKPYYINVCYRECDIVRNRNIKIFKKFDSQGYELKKVDLGRGNIYAYSLGDFYDSAIQSFKEDIYIWLDQEPNIKPYLK